MLECQQNHLALGLPQTWTFLVESQDDIGRAPFIP